MDIKSLIKNFQANSSQIMWLLGAGTSRSANMPTANDLIWDLKLKHYCLEENIDIKDHDISNSIIQSKVQSYMDSKGYPPLWSNEEYSFYFELTFGEDYRSQQKYLLDQLKPNKISLNIGHKVLAGLLGSNHSKIVYTTNFDEVIETAYANIIGKNLPTYHLEGSYAVTEALNQENFPIYAKMHGDFRYQSTKNLSKDLLDNDAEIRKSFIASASRYGLIVTGYSGRDSNVMSMINEAIEQNNAFPHGLFWTVVKKDNVLPEVTSLINKAKSKGINSEIIEAGTFDSLMLSVWKQLPSIDKGIADKISSKRNKNISIPLQGTGVDFPMIRTNALPIGQLPIKCAEVNLNHKIDTKEFYDLVKSKTPKAILIKSHKILAWGAKDEILNTFSDYYGVSLSEFVFENPISDIDRETTIQSFFERALVNTLVNDKPLKFRHDKNAFVIIPHDDQVNNEIFKPIVDSLSKPNFTAKIKNTTYSNNVFFIEALEVKMEVRNNHAYLMLRPTIWVEPKSERANQLEKIRTMKQYRFNNVSNSLLNAWISVLFGNKEKGGSKVITSFEDTEYPIQFEISLRTSYSNS